jgi:hypothetical protein
LLYTPSKLDQRLNSFKSKIETILAVTNLQLRRMGKLMALALGGGWVEGLQPGPMHHGPVLGLVNLFVRLT